MRRADVALIALASVFSMEILWYKIVMQRPCLKVRVHTEKIQMNRAIFHGIPLENVAY